MSEPSPNSSLAASFSLERVILFVQDVEKLARFYGDVFGLPVVEKIEGEWAVLRAGSCELALHRVGEPWRVEEGEDRQAVSNAKLVFRVRGDLARLRAALIAKGVAMQPIKSYLPLTGPLCDGHDPEGNVFQLAQAN